MADFKLLILAMGQMTSSLGVPIGVFYIVLPLCGILNMIYTVLNIMDIMKMKDTFFMGTVRQITFLELIRKGIARVAQTPITHSRGGT